MNAISLRIPPENRRSESAPGAMYPAAVIVVAYHGTRWIDPCLKSLTQASRQRLQVIVVDNGGNEGSIPESCPEFGYTVVPTPRSLGFAEANNFALVKCAGVDAEAICFLNQDTVSEPGWIDACLACLRTRPEVGAISPFVRTYDRSEWDPAFLACARESAEFRQGMSHGRFDEPFYCVPRVPAAAMLVRTTALARVGPFDPIFESYYEDYDLCRRIRLAGYQVGICSGGAIGHFSGSSTTSEAAVRRRMRQILRNRAILNLRDAGDRRWPALIAYLAWTLPRNLARSLLGTPSSQPFPVQVAANWDLLRQWRRIISSTRDERDWFEYLKSIGWPNLNNPVSHEPPRHNRPTSPE